MIACVLIIFLVTLLVGLASWSRLVTGFLDICILFCVLFMGVYARGRVPSDECVAGDGA